MSKDANAVEACRLSRKVLDYIYIFGAQPTARLAELCNAADTAVRAVIEQAKGEKK